MEYFRGLLFLTTNRIGHIDDAFLSRVHVVIEYKKLDDKTRAKIWEGFFEKLKHEKKGEITVHAQAKKYVLESEEVEALKWNGREIRNALQTALALADYEASQEMNGDEGPVVVVSEHFRRVVEMSRAFYRYMDSIDMTSESKRARLNYDRNDEFEEHQISLLGEHRDSSERGSTFAFEKQA